MSIQDESWGQAKDQVGGNYFINNDVWAHLGCLICRQVRDQVEDQFRNQVSGQIWGGVVILVWNELYANVLK